MTFKSNSFKMGNKLVDRLLVVVAMKVEEDAALAFSTDWTGFYLDEKLCIKGHCLKVGNRNLFLVNSGIGGVNAGIMAAMAYSQLNIDGILLLGVAGALQSDLEIGDLVVPSKILQHDSVFSGESGNEFMAPGAPFVSVHENDREPPVFDLDFSFSTWLKSQAICNYKTGTLLSGNEFVGTAKRKVQLAKMEKDALAVEMEGSGIALVAKKYKIPFAIAKTIADKLNPNDTISSDYNRFLKRSAENAGKLVSHICESWQNEV